MTLPSRQSGDGEVVVNMRLRWRVFDPALTREAIFDALLESLPGVIPDTSDPTYEGAGFLGAELNA